MTDGSAPAHRVPGCGAGEPAERLTGAGQPAERLAALVGALVELFNACLRRGDWSPFVATFAEDARMAFTNVPVGPFVGRTAIAAAYAAQPPTDTMHVLGMEPVDADTARVRFAWDAGGTGTMVVRWRGERVADLDITFD